MIQGVAVLCEDEQSAPAIFQFVELSFRQAIAKRGKFGVRGVVAHAACLRQQVPKRGNLGPELVELDCRRELVRQQVAFGFVEVVFILLGGR